VSGSSSSKVKAPSSGGSGGALKQLRLKAAKYEEE
jgi:hypothetical protein